MDLLTEIPTEITPAVEKSPFWWKTYGGYTADQIEFINTHLGNLASPSIYDPMSGQAFSLCQMAWHGARVHLNDINPGPLCLASLRDPKLVSKRAALGRTLMAHLRRADSKRRMTRRPEYHPNWISPEVIADLQNAATSLGIDLSISPFAPGSVYWRQEPITRLAVALIVLAARSLCCFRTTDNRTWLRKGGVTPAITVRAALLDANRLSQHFFLRKL